MYYHQNSINISTRDNTKYEIMCKDIYSGVIFQNIMRLSGAVKGGSTLKGSIFQCLTQSCTQINLYIIFFNAGLSILSAVWTRIVSVFSVNLNSLCTETNKLGCNHWLHNLTTYCSACRWSYIWLRRVHSQVCLCRVLIECGDKGHKM